MKKFLLFNILFCAFVGVGFAQTITVDKDVICKGDISYLATDTNLNYVHIGDILCFQGTDTANYIIVRPEAWSMYEEAGYTPLSVVFYVDQSGKHGWAVGLPLYDSPYWSYSENIWSNEYINLECLADYDDIHPRASLADFDGFTNTECIRLALESCEDCYPAVADLPDPFYLPAIGQINCLFSYKYLIDNVILSVLPYDSENYYSFLDYSWWWSSTESDDTFVITFDAEYGMITTNYKNDETVILPVMDF